MDFETISSSFKFGGQLGYASAISGGLSGGAVTKLMVHPGGKFTPGLVVFSLLSYLGQGSWNMVERWHLSNQGKKESRSILQRMADSKWIPLRSLSDNDFKHILNEKILSMEVEIALLDDKIQSLEDERAAVAGQKGEQSSQDGRPKAC
ncbi:hypothetical protein UA08_06649 [Talaromyces atroroseus]|uniref:Uncharacterized protein n=1 Tax=Talaromyces atroroseus TaxID=1441469 RepID=A0A225AAZ5_TALAT|nr:hypothetical protein UA08_06649 [Talaromyces atroroseus]OKL58191.1 hypothetical protein UA08_06649 [Talaromyces atroroseus]